MPPLASDEPPVTLQSELLAAVVRAVVRVVARLVGGGERGGDHEAGGDADGDDAELLQHGDSWWCRGSRDGADRMSTTRHRDSYGPTRARRGCNVQMCHYPRTGSISCNAPKRTKARPPGTGGRARACRPRGDGSVSGGRGRGQLDRDLGEPGSPGSPAMSTATLLPLTLPLRMSLQTMLRALAPPTGACARSVAGERVALDAAVGLGRAAGDVAVRAVAAAVAVVRVVARLVGGGERGGDHEAGGDADGDDAELLQHENSWMSVGGAAASSECMTTPRTAQRTPATEATSREVDSPERGAQVGNFLDRRRPGHRDGGRAFAWSRGVRRADAVSASFQGLRGRPGRRCCR